MNIWIIFALISALSVGIQGVFRRKVMVSEDHYAYALLENLFTAIIFIPFLFTNILIPSDLTSWLIIFLSSLLWTVISVLSFKSYKYTQASIRPIFSQSRVIFLLILSVIFFNESITFEKIIGTLLVFSGLAIINFKPGKILGSLKDKGIQLTLLGSIFAAMVAVIDKISITKIEPVTFSFFVYILPALYLIVFAKKDNFINCKKIITKEYLPFIIIVVLGASFYYFKLLAYKLADVSIVFPIIRFGSAITVICGIVFLKERNNVIRKLISILISFLGVLIISGNYKLIWFT